MLEQPPTVSKPLASLGAEIVEINTANGWDVTKPSDWPAADDSDAIVSLRKLSTNLMLMVTEVAEAMEALRKCDRANFEEELADTLIRILDTSHGLGIDMDAVVAKKLAKNRTRGYRHGGKAV